MANPTEPRDDTKPPVNPGAIQDWRVKPPGVLPRHVQMWVMVIIALVILAIILLTGHPQPLPRPQAGARSAQPTLVPPDRVRSYEQQLAADLVREPQGLAPSSAPAGRATQARGSRRVLIGRRHRGRPTAPRLPEPLCRQHRAQPSRGRSAAVR